MSDSDGSNGPSKAVQALWRNIAILMILVAAGFIAVISIVYFMHDTEIVRLGYQHFASIFGLPAAAAAALAIVLVTRSISGPMSAKFLGFEFQGAASEALMWILCFLAIVFAIEKTWPLEYALSKLWQ
jgi:hypothetical protein